MKNKSFYIENTSRIKVEILRDKPSIHEAKVLDDLVFKDHQGIKLSEITAIAERGGLLGIRSSDSRLIAEAQIIFHSNPGECDLEPNTALCYGSAVHPSYRRLGLGQALMKAKEKLAIEKNKQKLILTVRPENAQAILLWQKCGFSFYGYDPNYFGDGMDGGRLMMEKLLYQNRIQQRSNTLKSISKKSKTIQIHIGNTVDNNARKKLIEVVQSGKSVVGYQILDSITAIIKVDH